MKLSRWNSTELMSAIPHLHLQDVDKMAPGVWIQLMESVSPSDFFEGLKQEDKVAIERWKSHRNVLLQTRIQQEVQAKIDEEPLLDRRSTPFIRVLVKSYYRSLSKKGAAISSKDEAILTVWSPTEEQLNLLKEGIILSAENLSVRHKYNGRLQLTANSRTQFSHLPSLPSACDLVSVGYRERSFASCFRIHVCSRQLLQSPSKQGKVIEYDFIGVVLRVVEQTDRDVLVSIYLTDRSGLVLRVQCGTMKGFGDSVGLRSSVAAECVEHPRVAVFRDLHILPFDTVDNCAVADFQAVSCVRPQHMEPRTEELRQWAESHTGRSCLRRLAAYIDAELCPQQRPVASFTTAVGYIAGFNVHSSNQLRILVDCATENLQEWAFPFHLLKDVVLPGDFTWSVSLNAEEEVICSRLKLLGKFFRARGVLYRFALKRTPQTITSFRLCDFEVCRIHPLNPSTLYDIYQAL